MRVRMSSGSLSRGGVGKRFAVGCVMKKVPAGFAGTLIERESRARCLAERLFQQRKTVGIKAHRGLQHRRFHRARLGQARFMAWFGPRLETLRRAAAGIAEGVAIVTA